MNNAANLTAGETHRVSQVERINGLASALLERLGAIDNEIAAGLQRLSTSTADPLSPPETSPPPPPGIGPINAPRPVKGALDDLEDLMNRFDDRLGFLQARAERLNRIV